MKLNIVLLLWIIKCVHNMNPCLSTGHSKFPRDSIGLRNENCTIPGSHEQICDKYLDSPTWYIIEGGKLLNHCPSKGSCGNAYPAWMDGSYPTEKDGEINMTVCIKRNNDCCKDHVTMRIKNCSTFFVYHLKPLKECTSAYCIESDLPCRAPTTTTQTTTTVTTTPESDLRDQDIALIIGVSIIAVIVLAGAIAFVCSTISKR
ncbi:pancreatic secretory granule membrane major glycoprotein GP2-like [Ruditapes philippinarum]|uniref:pancreatic secretory granule membrane major glycoprotein GP2-like n=1 Tax=Ruditapes philippinarum TaxID=129788 RepID=UPI00295A77EB|nr:pancreatic secretory granule membrane major glycoprotein GP2-like [Ruditapes philippinarum]